MNQVMTRAFDPDRLLKGASIPPWLGEFAAEPETALDDLLAGRAYLGHLSPLEPVELLGDWLRLFSKDTEFVSALEDALSAWIDRHWGDYLLAGSARVAAEAWTQVTSLLASAPLGDDDERLLGGAADRLRSRVLGDRRFLNGLSEGRGRDPMGGAWRALAMHQRDRELLSEWWRLCRLPVDEPWYRGSIGVVGLDKLPLENSAHKGGFNKPMAEGLARLGEAFQRRAEEGWLEMESAREEFQVRLQIALRSQPFDKEWRSFWRHALTGRGDEPLVSWVRELFTNLRIPEEQEPGGKWAEPDPNWKERREKLQPRLSRHEPAALDPAKQLLDAQRHYADMTGDNHYFVRTACNFASRIRDWQPEQALDWVRTAREYEPSNAHAWTTETECLRALGKDKKALSHAIEAARRFPSNPVAQNTLAEVLREAGQLPEAEAVYSQTIARGIADDNSYNALGEVLKEQGRFTEAKAQYELARDRYPNNPVPLNGMAEVYRAEGDLTGAQQWYQEAHRRFPDDEYVRNGLRVVERELREGPTVTTQVPEPEPSGAEDGIILEMPALDSDTIAQITTDSFLLRRWARQSGQFSEQLPASAWRERARSLLEQLNEVWMRDPEAAESYALLRTTGAKAQLFDDDSADRTETLRLLEEAAKCFPGSTRVRYALASAGRAAGATAAQPWRSLARLDARLEPVRFLGTGRSLLESDPGKARDALGQLAYWCRQYAPTEPADPKHEDDEQAFTRWWSRQLRKALLDEAENAETLPELDELRDRLRENGAKLDDLEETFVDRHAWA